MNKREAIIEMVNGRTMGCNKSARNLYGYMYRNNSFMCFDFSSTTGWDVDINELPDNEWHYYVGVEGKEIKKLTTDNVPRYETWEIYKNKINELIDAVNEMKARDNG